MKNIVLTTNHDDWEAIFLDGKQQTAGHKIELNELIPYLRDGDFTIERWSVNSEYTYDLGCYPDLLSDIPEKEVYQKVIL